MEKAFRASYFGCVVETEKQNPYPKKKKYHALGEKSN